MTQKPKAKKLLQVAREAWDPEKIVVQYDDVRLKMLSYAILAPNPFNKQPWHLLLKNKNEINLYIDPDRLLPMTDPLHRLIYASQGTFLELLSIAAKEFGYKPTIQLFPEGIDPVEKTGKSPMASIIIAKTKVEKDDLFSQIPLRVTNHRPSKGPPITEEELNILQKSYSEKNYPMRFITDAEKISKIANLMSEAFKIEVYTERTYAETPKMFRFNADEVATYRDGFSYENMGVTGNVKFFAEKFSGRDKSFSESFKKRTVNSVEKNAHSAKVFGIMFTQENNRIEQVEIGRRYARVHLMATKLNLSMQMMSQILEEYEELVEVQKKFLEIIKPYTGVPQLIFRIGHAKPTPHSPRRKLEDFLKS
ncbi:MAG TPA: hypothetical protein ENH75_01115 [archaeon]|nr:hypothetical protein [archaeon]